MRGIHSFPLENTTFRRSIPWKHQNPLIIFFVTQTFLQVAQNFFATLPTFLQKLQKSTLMFFIALNATDLNKHKNDKSPYRKYYRVGVGHHNFAVRCLLDEGESFEGGERECF